MSYILDALKKSEQERKKGQVPGLGTVQGLPGPSGRFQADRLIWMYGLATILLLAALALGVWLFPWKPAPAPEETPPPVVAVEPAADKAAAPPEAKPTPPAKAERKALPAKAAGKASANGDKQPSPSPPTAERGSPEPLKAVIPTPAPPAPAAPAPAPASPAPAPAPPAPVAEKPQPEPAQASEPPTGSPFVEEKEPEESEVPVKPELLPTIPFEELPAETRAEMPEIKIGVHLFSETPASRRASINGRLMREGQQVDKDLVLVEITRQGAILSFRGRKFSLPVFPR